MSPCFAQQTTPAQGSGRPVVAKSIDGVMSIDGAHMPAYSSIFLNDEVSANGSAHLRIVNEGNSLTFTPDSSFRALKNAFRLSRGGSKVATNTGMTAFLPNCYSVTPTNPLFTTLYEVNWSGPSVWIYARSHDVRINYWKDGDTHHPEVTPNLRPADQGWIVKEGHLARLRDVKLCKPLFDWWPQQDLATGLQLAGFAGTVASEPFWFQKHNLSASGPE